ncbi:hypothetical protein JW935_05820 [candidate division KSB1 bacterium]|nr:hypothetical protein [candidate division KSB1 bacterium]
MLKVIIAGRMVSFIVTLLSTIPLFVHYVMGTHPKKEIITHLHVWFGLAFIIFAVMSMVMKKRKQHAQNTDN